MRILVVTQYFWPETFRINDVVAALEEGGAEVTVLTGQPNYPAGRIFLGYSASGWGADAAAPNGEVIRVPLITRGRGGALRLAANYLSFIVTATLLGTWSLRARRYDVIFVYGVSPILQAIPAIWFKLIKRAPLVLWVQDLWPQSLEVTGYVENRGLLAAVGSVTQWIYRRCDLLLGQSRAFVKTLRLVAGRTPVEYYPSPGERQPEAVGEPALMLPDGFNIVFAGNLGTAQALPTILDAAEALTDVPNLRFVLVGDGSRREWAMQEVERRKLANVQFPGRFPPTAIPGILAQASVLLVSLNRSDILAQTVPAKISTYLSTGKPIAASMDGEGAEIIRQAGAGIASPAEDAVALADAMRRLSSMDAVTLDGMGAAGKRYFESELSQNVLAERLAGILDKVVRTSR